MYIYIYNIYNLINIILYAVYIYILYIYIYINICNFRDIYLAQALPKIP